jgi:hypothetical protein
VYIKLEASPIEPKPTLFGSYIGMSVDKGNQSQSGVHAPGAGTISAETDRHIGDLAVNWIGPPHFFTGDTSS